jgi:hypothetical protein
MGWFGYGKYDGDGTATLQMEMVELAGFKRNIPLANGNVLDEAWEWSVGQAKLASEVVDAVFSKWGNIQKKMRPVSRSYYDDEDKAIFDMMAADFFINHGVVMPEDLKARIGDSMDYLMGGDHAGDFKNPAARRRVLRTFKAIAVDWE